MRRFPKIQIVSWSTSTIVHLVLGVCCVVSLAVYTPPEFVVRPGGGPIRLVVELTSPETETETETDESEWHVHAPSVFEHSHSHPEIGAGEVHVHRHRVTEQVQPQRHSLKRRSAATRVSEPVEEEALRETKEVFAKAKRSDLTPSMPKPKEASSEKVQKPSTRPTAQLNVAVPLVDLPEQITDSDSGHVDSIPKKKVNNPAPPYPPEIYAQGIQGKVTLEVDVNALGRVDEIRIWKSSGTEKLDASALATVRNWEFEPARRGEKPVPYTIRVPVRFSIRGR